MSENPFAALTTHSRVSLAHLPTPVEPLPRLSEHLGGPALWIKRDDQTGLALGGNKTRKLEYLLADARQRGADCVITAGSIQSNHARQTAAAAAKLGLACHLVLRGTEPAAATGNVLLDVVLGATLHWTDEPAPYHDTLTQVEARLNDAGEQPYLVPYGGSNARGILGYVAAAEEYWQQSVPTDHSNGPFEGPMDTIVFPTSSGGTQAGLLLGMHLLRAHAPGLPHVVGISVDLRADDLRPRVADLAQDGAALLGLSWRPDDTDTVIDDRHLGDGYGVVGDTEREAIRLMAEYEGILVDPVYTGRALAGLIASIRRGEFSSGQRVLFWHTGGTPALFADDYRLNLKK